VLLKKYPQVFGLAAVVFLANFAHYVYPSVFVLFAEYQYRWSEEQVGLVLAVVGVCSVIVQAGLIGPLVKTLGERRGLTFVDDSIATTPQATLEALASFSGRRVTVLVGGHDRGLDWRPFADAMHATPPNAIVTMGANGERIRASLQAAGGNYRLGSAATLAGAVQLAIDATPAGGVVLLSPGAPSFDQFSDYVERGCTFARLAGFDPAMIGAIEGLGIA
jgi:hypothetical protein